MVAAPATRQPRDPAAHAGPQPAGQRRGTGLEIDDARRAVRVELQDQAVHLPHPDAVTIHHLLVEHVAHQQHVSLPRR